MRHPLQKQEVKPFVNLNHLILVYAQCISSEAAKAGQFGQSSPILTRFFHPRNEYPIDR